MEFGLDQLRIDLRPGSRRSELSRHVEIARICSKLVADLLARPIADSELDDRPNSSSLQVCDQLRADPSYLDMSR